MAQAQDITAIYRGETVTLNFTLTPVEDITGWTLSCRIKRAFSDVTALLTIAGSITVAASGTFSVPLTAAQTLALPAGQYVYDVWRTDSGSEAALAIGTVPVKGTVKYP